MFCERCGESINEEVNFCKSCGTRVNKTEVAEIVSKKDKMVDNLAIALIFVFLFSLGAFMGLMALLLDKGVEHRTIMLVSLFFLATVFGISYMLIQQISKLVDFSIVSKQNTKKEFVPHQINPVITAQLDSPKEPFVSVTENTTKTLNKVLIKR